MAMQVSYDETKQCVQTQLSADVKAWSARSKNTKEQMASHMKQSRAPAGVSLNKLVVNVSHSCKHQSTAKTKIDLEDRHAAFPS